MARAFRLGELAQHVGGRVVGDVERPIDGIATLERAGARELSFLTNPRYRDRVRSTAAGALLVAPESGIAGRDLLESPEPYLALARLLELFHPAAEPRFEISPRAHVAADAVLHGEVAVGPFAVIESGVELGRRVIVGAGCVIGEGAWIGDASELKPRVVLYPGTRVGARCRIHAGVVLGADGFGYATSAGVHHKVPQLGRVVVEDDVEIGANSTADRGTLDETVIERGCKVDNLVMIAHGVRLGHGALLAAQSGIAGSTRVGAGSRFAGQSGAAGHLEIGEHSVVAAKSAVLQDLPPRSAVAGIPAGELAAWRRTQALLRRLPEMARELRRLRERVAELERERGRS